jgi:hypothetical protein
MFFLAWRVRCEPPVENLESLDSGCLDAKLEPSSFGVKPRFVSRHLNAEVTTLVFEDCILKFAFLTSVSGD